jgi:hypothetical protein
MSTRHQGQNRIKSVPVSATIARELYDWIEHRIDTRQSASRSHAINEAIGFFKWILENHPELYYGRTMPTARTVQQPQPPHPPQPDKDQYYPH